MEFFNRVKNFFGLSRSGTDQNCNRDSDCARSNVGEELIIRENPRERSPDEFERFGFNMFSNPLEMHRYFEHQMNEMMKSFGMFGNQDAFFGNSLFGENTEPFFDDNAFNNDFPQFPAVEDFHKKDQQEAGSLRDRYLKPGYEQAKPNEKSKSDKDLDGKFDMGDLDSVLTGRPSQTQPRSFFFGQSMTSKTIRNPDGGIEIHKTVKDQHGNEETTITRKQGDKEYSIITRTDKDGHQEVIENLVNMEEQDKDAFLKGSGSYGKLTDETEKVPANWFPFDKFFKH